MKPIETPETDVTYAGVASKGIGLLPTQTIVETLPDRTLVTVHRSVWEFDSAERSALMLGSRLVVDVYGEAVPPMRFAVAEPTLVDPDSVYKLVDEAINISVGTSLASVLRELGVERSASTIAAYSENDRREVSDWLRGIGEGAKMGVPPRVLELAIEERERMRDAIATRQAPKEAPTDG